jgi:hypothetical protein
MFDLEKAERNMEYWCDFIERMNTPNPLNPLGMSEIEYTWAINSLHDDTWVRTFVPGD